MSSFCSEIIKMFKSRCFSCGEIEITLVEYLVTNSKRLKVKIYPKARFLNKKKSVRFWFWAIKAKQKKRRAFCKFKCSIKRDNFWYFRIYLKKHINM